MKANTKQQKLPEIMAPIITSYIALVQQILTAKKSDGKIQSEWQVGFIELFQYLCLSLPKTASLIFKSFWLPMKSYDESYGMAFFESGPCVMCIFGF